MRSWTRWKHGIKNWRPSDMSSVREQARAEKNRRNIRAERERRLADQHTQANVPSFSGELLNQVGELAQGFNKGVLGTADLLASPISAAADLAGFNPGATPITDAANWLGQSTPQWLGGPGDVAKTGPGSLLSRFGEAAGGAAAPTVALEKLAADAVRKYGPRAVKYLRSINANPQAIRAAETASALGAGTGANIGAQFGPTEELIGSVAGGFGPATAGVLAKGALRGGEKGRQLFAEGIDEIRSLGGQPSVGQGGSPLGQVLESATSKFPVARGMHDRRQGENLQQLAQATEREALGVDGVNIPLDNTSLGANIQEGVRDWVKRFDIETEGLYKNLERLIPKNTRVDVTDTMAQFEKLTKGIEGAPGTNKYLTNPKLNELSEVFQHDALDMLGGLEYSAVRKIRSKIGRIIRQPTLHKDEPHAELAQIYKSLTKDMEKAARAAGPEAEQAFHRANTRYAEGSTFIKDKLDRIVAQQFPERIAKEFQNSVRAGKTYVENLREALTDDEFDLVRSQITHQLGTANPGQQNATGTLFSANTFLTQWNQLRPEVKDAIYGATGDSSMRRNMDTIASVAQRLSDAERAVYNPSGTAGSLVNTGAVIAPAAAIAANSMGLSGIKPLAVTVLTLASAPGVQKLLQSPRFVDWLAKSTRIPVLQMPNHGRKLMELYEDSEEDPELQAAIDQYGATLLTAVASTNLQDETPVAKSREKARDFVQSTNSPLPVMAPPPQAPPLQYPTPRIGYTPLPGPEQGNFTPPLLQMLQRQQQQQQQGGPVHDMNAQQGPAELQHKRIR